MIVILCGKSGCGKDFISKNLIKEYDFKSIVSYTTRPMRENETNGVDYNFISNYEFIKGIEKNEFLEYRVYNTLYNGIANKWYYGIKKQELNNDDYIVILDLNGTKSFIDYYGKDNCKVFYIEVNDKIRTERAKKRGSFSSEEWNRRLKADNLDFSEDKLNEIVDYRIVNENKNIEEIVKEIVDKL